VTVRDRVTAHQDIGDHDSPQERYRVRSRQTLTGGADGRGLRVKAVQGASGVFEMTRADDGRATFQYGNAILEGEPHVIWRRVGIHEIFKKP
jgi:hypothetical protein